MRSLRILLGLTIVSLGCLAAAPVLAEQIVHFSNGSTMPIRGHTVKAGMIHVDLGDDGFMAFPEHRVDKITEAGKEVVLRPSFSSNQIAEGIPRKADDYRVTGQKRTRERKPIPTPNEQATPVEVDEETGLASYRPFGRSNNRAMRGLQVTGNTKALGNQAGSGNYRGTTRRGVHQVMQSGGAKDGPGSRKGRRGGVKPVGLEPRAAGGGADKK